VRGLIVPGLNNSGPAHWQTLWERQYGFQRVEQRDWENPDAAAWVQTLDAAIREHSDRVIIIAHSLGCWTGISWAALSADSKDLVQAALLVAPPSITSFSALPESAIDFAFHPTEKFPFPSILVGSENDPYMTLEGAQALAHATGSTFVNAGFAGHINVDSGYGPWLQGELLLRQLINNQL
jgi:predicted alpha/beta hydrolase family esterase